MSGVSDISFRALVMCGSSAEVAGQELTHSATYRAEITLDSISYTPLNALLSFFLVSLIFLKLTQLYPVFNLWVILTLITAAGTDFFLLDYPFESLCSSLLLFLESVSHYSVSSHSSSNILTICIVVSQYMLVNV